MGLARSAILIILRRHPEQLQAWLNYSDGVTIDHAPVPQSSAHLIPTGWFYQNQLRCARLMVELLSAAGGCKSGNLFSSRRPSADAALTAETKHRRPFQFPRKTVAAGAGQCREEICLRTKSVDLARVAIALERYRLAHGEYPESLDALSPQFIDKLPHDIINGQPLHYRRTSDGQFVLYSVGWNETDDGGEVGLRKDGNGGHQHRRLGLAVSGQISRKHRTLNAAKLSNIE